jgi:hypothetical protein
MQRRVLEKVQLLPANASVMLSITSCRGIVCLALNGALGGEHGLPLDQVSRRSCEHRCYFELV